ncbi:MAG: NADH-quinone oxidoreductase subunit J [Caldilineae bacterium]|nr:NADH-quinone oxidoreductase subunit J [Chloroflexota bacterium]MCB9176500.1 NADH-quinone oxidoreductase subunit J [Caldilineae bacterium]
MSGELLLFYVVAALMVATALSMVMARDLVHGVLFMVGNFVLTAIVYLLLQAPFIAAVQLAVYAGAIMVLFLFVVMLLGARELDMREPLAGQRFWGLALVGLLGALLVFVTGEGVPAAPPAGLAEGALAQAQTADGAWLGADALAALPAAERAALDDLGGFGSPQMVGEALYTDAYHLLPFELVSLLLLVAMLGAVVIAHYPARPGAEAGEESAT